MKSYQNWLDVTLNRDNFNVNMHLYDFHRLPFQAAAEFAAIKIYEECNKPLYVALSGGADSEFVVRLFHRLDIPFYVVIGYYPGAHNEFQQAQKICEELNITPIYIYITEQQLVERFEKQIHQEMGRTAFNVGHFLAVDDFVTLNNGNGTCITGDFITVDGEEQRLTFEDLEFFGNNISLFYYTIELFYAYLKEIRPGERTETRKSRIYGTSWRPKFYPTYEQKTHDKYNKLIQNNTIKTTQDLGSARDLLNFFERLTMKYSGIYNNPHERTTTTYPYVWWDGAFTDAELQQIIDYCELGGLDRAKIMGENEDVDSIRRCDVKFHHRNNETAWIFDRLNNIADKLNDQFYGFDLNGYDSFQYTSYNSGEKGTYHWHMDTCFGNEALPANMIEPRKLSLTLLLNDDFEGGEFMINQGSEERARQVPIPKGRVIAFPSFFIHSVKPVTKGFRKSVVVWVVGPKWR